MPSLIALSSLALAQDVTINDSLLSSSSATTVYGGTFTGAGWRVDDSNSRMFWDFGTQVDHGEVSVVIDDVTLASITGANNHLIELFDSGGHWSANRAINMRVYGDGGSDWGQVKLKCWDPTAAAEARTPALDWDGNPHTWKITWDTTHCALARDGVELLNLDTTGIDLSVGTLWLPLNDWTGDYSAPIGALYTDLHLKGWEPHVEVDTGVPDDGDANTYAPMQDVAGVSWQPSAVYSEKDDLCAESDSGPPDAVSYLQYDLSDVAGTITSARLTLHARNSHEAEGDGASVYAVANTAWTEDSLTWDNRPDVGAKLGSTGAVTASGTYTVDVTAGVKAGQRVALAMVADGGNGVHFSSKEDGDGSAAAMLRITVAADSSDADTDADTDTDADGDADTDADTDAGNDSGRGGRNVDDYRAKHGELGANGGCGCNEIGTVRGFAWLAGLLILAWRRR